MSEQDKFDLLLARAKGVASDISADFPGHDVAFNLYVETLDGIEYGLIDMGDMYQGTFVFEDGEWHDDFTINPYELEDRILDQRRLVAGL